MLEPFFSGKEKKFCHVWVFPLRQSPLNEAFLQGSLILRDLLLISIKTKSFPIISFFPPFLNIQKLTLIFSQITRLAGAIRENLEKQMQMLKTNYPHPRANQY